jgi:hypothetical protein
MPKSDGYSEIKTRSVLLPTPCLPTPTEEEIRIWQALSRDEQLRRLRPAFIHPDRTASMKEILAEAFETMSDSETIVLWRPVGPVELELIKELKMRAFPPRLSDQPIFYPVLSEEYAAKIARDWNVPASGRGFVTRFRVRKAFLDSYQAREAGGRAHLEYWIPADELDAFNQAIVGAIEIIAEFP